MPAIVLIALTFVLATIDSLGILSIPLWLILLPLAPLALAFGLVILCLVFAGMAVVLASILKPKA